jgi:hypothetical protein
MERPVSYSRSLILINFPLNSSDCSLMLDYLWLDPMTGAITCSLNLGGSSWKRAGNNNGLIATGEGKGSTIFLAVG